MKVNYYSYYKHSNDTFKNKVISAIRAPFYFRIKEKNIRKKQTKTIPINYFILPLPSSFKLLILVL